MGDVIGAILQGSATNLTFFLIARTINGFGVNIGLVAAPALISEVAFPTHRTTATCAYNVKGFLGALLASVSSYLCKGITSNYSWKIQAYLQGFFPVMLLCGLYWIPESPRFLIAKGKDDKARAILSQYHVGGSTNVQDQDFVDFEMSEIEVSFELERLKGGFIF